MKVGATEVVSPAEVLDDQPGEWEMGDRKSLAERMSDARKALRDAVDAQLDSETQARRAKEGLEEISGFSGKPAQDLRNELSLAWHGARTKSERGAVTSQPAALTETTATTAPAKLCKLCGTVKTLDQFYPSKQTKDGRENRCKACKAEQLKAARVKKRVVAAEAPMVEPGASSDEPLPAVEPQDGPPRFDTLGRQEPVVAVTPCLCGGAHADDPCPAAPSAADALTSERLLNATFEHGRRYEAAARANAPLLWPAVGVLAAAAGLSLVPAIVRRALGR
jgi:hypothetical protein